MSLRGKRQRGGTIFNRISVCTDGRTMRKKTAAHRQMVHAEPSFVLNSDLKNNNCEHFL